MGIVIYMLNYIIFILLINVNIINAQGNTNVAISNQDNEGYNYI